VSTVQEFGDCAEYRILRRLRGECREKRTELLSHRACMRRQRAFLQLYVPHIQEWNVWFADLVAELQDCSAALFWFCILCICDTIVITCLMVAVRLLLIRGRRLLLNSVYHDTRELSVRLAGGSPAFLDHVSSPLIYGWCLRFNVMLIVILMHRMRPTATGRCCQNAGSLCPGRTVCQLRSFIRVPYVDGRSSMVVKLRPRPLLECSHVPCIY
jgi:hypothetical protein